MSQTLVGGSPTLLAPPLAASNVQTMRPTGNYSNMGGFHIDWVKVIIFFIIVWIIISVVTIIFNPAQLQYKGPAGEPNGSPNYGAIILSSFIWTLVIFIVAMILIWVARKV